MYQDSLLDQAEKLQIPGFVVAVPESNSRLNKAMPMAGAMRPKKLREERPVDAKESTSRDLARLKKEIEEKERLEKRMKDLEEEARRKEQMYKEKYQSADMRRKEQLEAKQAKAIRAQKPTNNQEQRSSSVPAERKQPFSSLAPVQQEKPVESGRPHAASLEESP